MNFETDQIAEVLDVERAWVAAHRSLDLEVLSRILSDEYRQIQSDGSVIGKDELLASYRSGLRRWDIAESDQHEVRVLGDVALLIGRWRGVGENKGKKFNYTAGFLAVYRREDREWKLVSDVSIPIAGYENVCIHKAIKSTQD